MENFDDYKTKTKLALPFKGTWIIGNGGRKEITNNHRRDDGSGPQEQTFAYDFKGTHQGDGKNIEDYEVFGQEVIATGDGIIAQVIDGSIDVQIGERDRGI